MKIIKAAVTNRITIEGIIMAKEFEAAGTTEEHRMIIDPVGFISEIINNIGDQRDVIRELISNAASKEIGAKEVDIRIYESDLGLAITVSDNGCGMNYTKNERTPGRLDKFLNAAQGKQAGFELMNLVQKAWERSYCTIQKVSK